MSNVLIGIIGVILFIGLALAGALFLGPRFQESTNNSRAAASVQAVSQVASAANMHRVQEGRGAADVATLVTEDYLKSVPSNPTGTSLPAMTGDANTITGRYVVMELGDNAAAVCDAINKQSGVTSISTVDDLTALPAGLGTQGCFTNTAVDSWSAYASI